jgi:hypothetical protein
MEVSKYYKQLQGLRILAGFFFKENLQSKLMRPKLSLPVGA